MRNHFFESRFPSACAKIKLLVLGLLAFAPTCFATTVTFDFNCISQNSVASCARDATLLHLDRNHVIPGKAGFFHHADDRAIAKGQNNFDDTQDLAQRLTALSLGRHGRVNFMKGGNGTHSENGTGHGHEPLWGHFRHAHADFSILYAALLSTRPRLGKHVQQAPDGGFSDSIVSVETAPAVPVPAAVWLFASGLFGLVGIARRRKRILPDQQSH